MRQLRPCTVPNTYTVYTGAVQGGEYGGAFFEYVLQPDSRSIRDKTEACSSNIYLDLSHEYSNIGKDVSVELRRVRPKSAQCVGSSFNFLKVSYTVHYWSTCSRDGAAAMHKNEGSAGQT